MSVAKLLDVILSAWVKSLEKPYGTGEYSSAIDGATDCNRFVNEVCERFGYNKFNGLLANEMYDKLMTNGDWIEVLGEAAQYHANQGAVVIAAYKNIMGRHGHVCLVRPGVPEPSASWEITEPKVPKVANVGTPENCRIDRKASFAFSKDKMPKYFALKSMI